MTITAKWPVDVELGGPVLLVDVEFHVAFGTVERLLVCPANDPFPLDPDGVSGVADHLDGPVHVVDVKTLVVRKSVVERLAGFGGPVPARGVENGGGERERSDCNSYSLVIHSISPKLRACTAAPSRSRFIKFNGGAPSRHQHAVTEP